MQRRFATLDGIWGIAAIGVASGHACAYLPLAWGMNLFPNYTLAVDLFFVLSGFVIAFAYEDKFEAGMKATTFMAMRVIRLYPLYLVGLGIAVATALAASLVKHPQMIEPATLLLATVAALLFLPSPTIWLNDSIAPLNFPGWSLIFELFANLVYAASYRKLTDAMLATIVAVSLIALLVAEVRIGSMNGGLHWNDLGVGLARVGFGFPLGILLYRKLPRRRIVSKWAYAIPVLVVPIFALRVGAAAWIEVPALLFAFPLIVAAGTMIEPPNERLFVWLGATSYALYVVHLPIVRIVARLAEMKFVTIAAVAPLPMLAVVAGLLALCAWIDSRYDAPVRRILLSRFRQRQSPSPA